MAYYKRKRSFRRKSLFGRKRRFSRYGKKPFRKSMLGRPVGHGSSGGIHTFYRKFNLLEPAAGTALVRSGIVDVLVAGQCLTVTQAASKAVGVQSFGSVGINIQLQHLPASSEFTDLFEQFRIRSVKVSLIPVGHGYDQTGLEGTDTGVPGLIAWSDVDYSDGTAPTASEPGVNTLRQKASTIMHRYPGVISRMFRPKCNSPLVSATGTTSSANQLSGPWIDGGTTNATTIQHFGMGVIFMTVSGGSVANAKSFTYQCECQVVVDCRYPK